LRLHGQGRVQVPGRRVRGRVGRFRSFLGHPEGFYGVFRVGMSVFDKIARMKRRWREWLRTRSVFDDTTDYNWATIRWEYNKKGCPRCGGQHQDLLYPDCFEMRCRCCKLEWSIWGDARSDGSRMGLDCTDSNYPSYSYIEDGVDRMVDITNGRVCARYGENRIEETRRGLFIVRVERSED